jgi:lysyl-tRNA synthetase class I
MNLRNSLEYAQFISTDYTNVIGVRLLMADVENWGVEDQNQYVKNIKIRAQRLDWGLKYLFDNINTNYTGEEIQTLMYDIAKKFSGDSKDIIRDFFSDLYCVLFNKKSGPRWGVFISLYGIENFMILVMNKMRNIHHV